MKKKIPLMVYKNSDHYYITSKYIKININKYFNLLLLLSTLIKYLIILLSYPNSFLLIFLLILNFNKILLLLQGKQSFYIYIYIYIKFFFLYILNFFYIFYIFFIFFIFFLVLLER